MDNSFLEYKTRVWDFLDTIEPGYYYEIQEICTPQTKDKFIACIKLYMDAKKPFQGYVTFNHDYSKIYKTNEITFKTKKA